MTTDDDFSEMLADDATERPPQATIWVRSPAVNFIELEILAMRDREPMLHIDIEFMDSDAAPREPENDPEMADVRRQISEMYATHLSLARSLGEKATIAEYLSMCVSEGLTPLPVTGG